MCPAAARGPALSLTLSAATECGAKRLGVTRTRRGAAGGRAASRLASYWQVQLERDVLAARVRSRWHGMSLSLSHGPVCLYHDQVKVS